MPGLPGITTMTSSIPLNTPPGDKNAEKWAKGPWHMFPGYDDDEPEYTVEGPHSTIAFIRPSTSNPDPKATATLMAAALDLLEALRMALPILQEVHSAEGYASTTVHRALTSAQSALTKATGDELNAAAELRRLQAENEQLQTNAKRYQWLRKRMLGVDFDWNEIGTTALSFEMPDGCAYGGDCDQNIDAAIAKSIESKP